MRKVLSFVLVLSLVLGSFAMAFAAPLSDIKGEKFEDAVNVLTELGVVKGYPDGKFKPANIVTRAEMAVIVVSALGLADYANGTAKFSDMAGHWSNPYVAYATSLGVISGYPDGTFKPDKTVSYDEASTMLVAALGYTPDSLVGTWPANFVTKAKTLGILDGIKAGVAGANRGDIAIMTFQTLNKAIGKTDKDGNFVQNDLGTDVFEADTMLGRLGAELYDPDGAGGLKAGAAFVLTGDEGSVINLRPFYGAYVTAYSNSDDEIIAIKEIKSVFLTGDFAAPVVAGADILAGADFAGTEKDYTVKSAVDTDDIEFFKNADNFAVTQPVVAATEYTVAVKISGTKITDIYSISEWVRDDAFLFKTDMLEDDNINGHDFTLDDDDEIDLESFELLGTTDLDSIKKDDVVYVYKHAGEITRVAVGTEVVTGEITKITSSAKKITVGGKAYAMYDGSAFTADLKDEVKLRIDAFGDVYKLDTVKGEASDYAVVLETADGVTGLNGKDGVVKLLLADGTDKVFTVDDDLVVAGVVAADGIWNAAFKVIAGSGNVVKYSVDKNGLIDSLEVVIVKAGFPVIGTKELTSKAFYNGKAVDADAVLFSYNGPAAKTDADLADEDNYSVTTVAKATGKEFKSTYYLKDGKILAMLIDGLGTTTEDIYGVVTGRAITTDSDTDYQLTVLVDGKEVKYDVTKLIYDEFGAATKDYLTLYKLGFNANDAISGLTAAAGGEIILGAATPATAYANEEVTAGLVYAVDTSGFAYKWNADDAIYKNVSISKTNLVGNNVRLYDTDEDGVTDLILVN